MPKYVLAEGDVEYNDEGYDISGIRGIYPKMFSSKEEAKEAGRKRLLELYGSYQFGEIENNWYDAGQLLEEIGMRPEGSGYYDLPSYQEVYDWMIERGELDWGCFPTELVKVFEVEDD